MTSMNVEVRVLFGRVVWRGVNIDDVTIHPSRGSRMNPTLKTCEHNRVAHASEAIPSPKPAKVTLFNMILCISQNSISKPIPKRSYVMFGMSHFSRHKPFCQQLFFHSSVVKYTSSLSQ